MGVEVLVQSANLGKILRVFPNDIIVGIGFNQTSRRSTSRRPHVRDEETTVWLGPDLVRDGSEESAVGFGEFGAVLVGEVKVVGGVLEFEKGEETTTDEGFAVSCDVDVVGLVAGSGNLGNVNQCAKSVLFRVVSLDLIDRLFQKRCWKQDHSRHQQRMWQGNPCGFGPVHQSRCR